MTRDIHESLRAGRPGTFHLKYDFDEERRLFQSERRGVMDLDIRSLMLYDAEDNLSNYLLVNIDNTERNNALSKVHDFENFFSIISDYSKVGYAKINLLDHTGFAVRQWEKAMIHLWRTLSVSFHTCILMTVSQCSIFMKRRKRVRNASLTVICVFVRQMVRIGGTGYTSLLW